MRTTPPPPSDDDESMHPLWLGMLMLFSLVLLIGTLCCLRVKCNSQLRHLFHRFFRRKTEDTSLDQVNAPPKEQSPRLYTLVNHLRRKQFAIRQQCIKDDDDGDERNTSLEFDHVPQISISSTLDNNRNSEIARKFYASLRNTSQCRNSPSLDGCHNDAQHTTNPSSLSFDQSIKPSRQGQMKFFRTPRFFKSIPNQDDLTL